MFPEKENKRQADKISPCLPESNWLYESKIKTNFKKKTLKKIKELHM